MAEATETLALTPELQALKIEFELEKLSAEARALHAKAKHDEYLAAKAQIDYLNVAEARAREMLGDDEARTLRFVTEFNFKSCEAAMETLARWHRYDVIAKEQDPEHKFHPFEIVISSYGGYIDPGLALYDSIRDMARRGHYITTRVLGYAYSFGAVLLQAGDRRILSPSARLMLHDGQGGMVGTYAEAQDEMDFWNLMLDRIHEILAGRSVFTKKELAEKMERRDWTMSARTAKRLGFCDEVK